MDSVSDVVNWFIVPDWYVCDALGSTISNNSRNDASDPLVKEALVLSIIWEYKPITKSYCSDNLAKTAGLEFLYVSISSLYWFILVSNSFCVGALFTAIVSEYVFIYWTDK